MNTDYHYTHYEVRPELERHANDIAARWQCSWNTYRDHPPGYGLDYTSIDFWGFNGRGEELGERLGDAITAWLLGQNEIIPIRWLIWYGWIWEPGVGWYEYHGWHGDHTDHIHVTFW